MRRQNRRYHNRDPYLWDIDFPPIRSHMAWESSGFRKGDTRIRRTKPDVLRDIISVPLKLQEPSEEMRTQES